ncbi:glycogen debranching protein GlgX [Sorangium sp. So ce131]|uniref:glycogen debranching protein GlgX n=1 Tax=Sorangium sp. So ce131 TaxID=3133282 RepID=UPI003F630F6F
MTRRIWPGTQAPLGAVYDGEGVNFTLFSQSATKVELCLFEAVDDVVERERIELPERTAHVFHGYVPGLKPGQLYGYRVHGPYDPRAGLRFNPAKLLVDPYAHAIANEPDWKAPLFAYDRGTHEREEGARSKSVRPEPLRDGDKAEAARGGKTPAERRAAEARARECPPAPAHPPDDLVICHRDSASGAPKSVVVDHRFAWDGDRPPGTPWQDTIIYEVHVKGFTQRHPGVPAHLRGTYAGLASEAAIAHFKKLGVTALELLPVHEMASEREIWERGLVNYWGYNTLSFFAPAGRYAATGRLGQQVTEFKAMVKALHAAGIEVILDVVYNHTAEGNHLGPTLSLKGIDNWGYYRLVSNNPRYYMDYTGCGNTVNTRHYQTLQLVMDSLRYWVTEMHVDGFRFDLASALARGLHDFDRLSSFFDIMHQDPVLSRVKLIAEPWDVGEGGYQVGNFPVLWTEWNDRYRDSVRRFWKGDLLAADLGYRLTGSSDLYGSSGRRPYASVNFVTAHDGFTLNDLVSYNEKHNEANGEGNRDGTNNNHSYNHGVEGPTCDPVVVELRERQKRNMLATLLLSQGVPMINAGDEIGKTQLGNNNAYCQDNEISWHDWDLDERRRKLFEFTCRLVALRRTQPVLRRRRFFSGGSVHGSGLKDIVWFRPDGGEMTSDDWTHPSARAIGFLLGGDAIWSLSPRGEQIVGDTLLVLINANPVPLEFVLPAIEFGERWEVLIDTRTAEEPARTVPARAGGERYLLIDRSLAVLRLLERKGPKKKSKAPKSRRT